MTNATAPNDAGPGCATVGGYSLGALVLGLIASVVVGVIAVSGAGEGDDLARDLRVNVGATILLAVAVTAFVFAWVGTRARAASGARAKGWRALFIYGAPGFFLALVIPLFIGWSAYIGDTADVAASGSQTIRLTGQMSGDSWRLSSTGELRTNAEYSETTVEVYANRIDTGSNTRTPSVTVRVGEATCTVSRNYIWSTAAGSSLTLLCDYYLSLDEIRSLTSGIVTG